MVIALTRKYVWMVNAKRVAEIIIIANQEQNAIKTHALLPAKWEIPANQLIIVILTTMFASQNVHQMSRVYMGFEIHIAMLDTSVPEDLSLIHI